MKKAKAIEVRLLNSTASKQQNGFANNWDELTIGLGGLLGELTATLFEPSTRLLFLVFAF